MKRALTRLFDDWRPKTAGGAVAQFAPFVLAVILSFWWRRSQDAFWHANLDKIPLAMATTTAVLAGFSTIPLGVLVAAMRREPFPAAHVAVRFLSRSATTALVASACSAASNPVSSGGILGGSLKSALGFRLMDDHAAPTLYCQLWVLLVAWAFLNFFRAIWTLRWLAEQ